MTSTKLYPGMCDDALEIFYNEEESQLMAIKGGVVLNYDQLSPSDTSFLDNILMDEPQTKAMLSTWFADPYVQKKTLAKCRFGGLNFTADYADGKVQPDVIKCGVMDSCKGFGIVCRSISYKSRELSQTDIKAMKLLASSKKNSVIAQELELPIGTFETYRTKLYKDLGGVTTKQEVARIAFSIGVL